MSEPRRSTRARAREEAVPPPETPKDTPASKPKSQPQSQSQSLKRKRSSVPAKDVRTTPSTDAASADQPPKQALPLKLVDGQPLPTLPEPQPLDLSAREYQDIQHSGVLSASLKQSRAVWVSGVNFRLFHALFTPPKKVADRTEEDRVNIARQKDLVKNFPPLGEAQLVIEPHTLTIRLYGPKDPSTVTPRPVQKKPTTYGQWGNHNQPGSYQYNHAQPAFQSTPSQRPPQPKPQPQSQRTPQAAPSQPQNPAPDPVIHMLAQRAGQDPELKAVMKIVAAGQATKEQLEFFQGHISELTALLERQKEAAAKAPRPQPPPPAPPAPKPAVAPPPPPAPKPAVAPPPPQPVAVAQSQAPPQQHQQHSAPRCNNVPPQAHQPQMAPAPSHHAPHHAPYNNPSYIQPPQQPFHPQRAPQYAPDPPPPNPTGYKPLVFDFMEGNGDKYYFPSYSFMEWLPGMRGAKFSFLITKLKPKPASKSEEKQKVPSTPAPKAEPAPAPTPTSTPSASVVGGNQVPGHFTFAPTPAQATTPTALVTPQVLPPSIQDYNEQEDINEIDFYQPVTVLVLSATAGVLHSLPRAVRPPDVVEKYMNEVFDTARRAEETFLAFRLPKEGGGDAEERVKSGDATPAVSTPIADVVMGGMGAPPERKKLTGRPRRSLIV
ncbi:hypothetical protein P280DRAFT_467321 [Massarina eburnea CBS 473.64]|uniref:SWR1-complex protein 3 domain-containing protein n=1 Tax=Massarina eburnea CBS 473.64 TaxID=1395130 RepID=A0A6A6S9Z5_9PLEO|nr:hypothetical protein P280DRAFT_467321 [Massarina eburnea CBS 473.64]